MTGDCPARDMLYKEVKITKCNNHPMKLRVQRKDERFDKIMKVYD